MTLVVYGYLRTKAVVHFTASGFNDGGTLCMFESRRERERERDRDGNIKLNQDSHRG